MNFIRKHELKQCQKKSGRIVWRIMEKFISIQRVKRSRDVYHAKVRIQSKCHADINRLSAVLQGKSHMLVPGFNAPKGGIVSPQPPTAPEDISQRVYLFEGLLGKFGNKSSHSILK